MILPLVVLIHHMILPPALIILSIIKERISAYINPNKKRREIGDTKRKEAMGDSIGNKNKKSYTLMLPIVLLILTMVLPLLLLIIPMILPLVLSMRSVIKERLFATINPKKKRERGRTYKKEGINGRQYQLKHLKQ